MAFAKVSTRTGCVYGKDPPIVNGEPSLIGVSADLLRAMKSNLRTIPGVKWQYYGNKAGVMFAYPADNTCSTPTYDPRLRFTAELLGLSDSSDAKICDGLVIYWAGGRVACCR